MLGTDNVKLTKEQMARVLDTIDKEEVNVRLEKDQKEKVVEKDETKPGDSPNGAKPGDPPNGATSVLPEAEQKQREGG